MPRMLFLDWVRIGAFALLVLYHTGMYYVSWDWHVKSPFANGAIEPLMLLSSPWRMSALFIVSGAATAVMLGPAQRTGFMRKRSGRLLLPLAAGVLLIVPPQPYFEVVQKVRYAGSYVDFLGLYFSGYGGFCRGTDCLVLPTWNHLWFLPYLWFYTLLLWLLLKRWPTLLADGASALSHALRGWRLLVWPVVWLALLRMTLLTRFGSTHALVDDWFNHASYFSMFMLGALFAQQRTLFDRLVPLRWQALGLALAAWALLALYYLHAAQGPVDATLRQAQRALWAGMQWTALVAVLGFARRHLERDHRWRAPLVEAVFPVYLLHQTLLICAAMAVRPLGWPPLVEGPLLVAITLAGSLGGWVLARRSRWLRPLLGMPKPPPTPDTRGAGAYPAT